MAPPKEFPDRNIEVVRGLLQNNIVRADGIGALHPVKAINDRTVFDHHSFGPASGAGGIDDVGQVAGRVDVSRILRVSLISLRAFQIDRRSGERDELRGLALNQEDADAGVLQQVADAVRRIVRRDGEISAAGLENAEQPDDHGERALDEEADDASGTDALRPQKMGELIGFLVQLGVGQDGRAKSVVMVADDRRPAAMYRNLRLE